METDLGISPGTRSIGIALIRNRNLIDWKLQSFKGKWSKEKLQEIIRYVSLYMDNHHVDAVAIKIPDDLPVSHNYIQLVGTLNVLFEQKGIQATYYHLSDIKKQFCPERKINKAVLVDCIVSKYPHLLPEYHKERNSRNKYYDKVFEAVGAAYILTDWRARY